MKTLVKLICLVLALSLLCGCAPQQANMEEILSGISSLGTSPDDNYRTWYEIFVYSFCDSDGDGIGDLNGVRSKLDYLQKLGITGIWLMPIHPSTTYHKYNVTDYYAIDPDYGTLADFEALLSECESRGIKVIMDLVLNHTGDTNPWFLQMTAYLQTLPEGKAPSAQECKYLDYYHLTTEATVGYNKVPGTPYYYECKFSSDMPDLNLDSQAVRGEIEDIMEFWLNKGVAGFRLDAAKEFWSGNTAKNVEVLNWIQTTAASLKPDCYLVAEVWDTFGQVTEYYQSGITSIFNFPFGDSTGKIVDVLRGAGNPAMVSTYATALETADSAYRGSNPNYIDAPFLSNHDVGRIAGFVAQNEQKTKLAGAMNLFMSGSAFIYYGEEIGMVGSGNDPSKRAPMYWNAERNDGTTKLPPECKLPENYPFGSLEEQKSNTDSIYNYYRQAVAIRKALPVISHGVTTAETALNKGCISAQKKIWNGSSCIILMNIDNEAAKVDLSAYADWKLAASLSADGSAITLKNGTLDLSAYGVAVLIPNS